MLSLLVELIFPIGWEGFCKKESDELVPSADNGPLKFGLLEGWHVGFFDETSDKCNIVVIQVYALSSIKSFQRSEPTKECFNIVVWTIENRSIGSTKLSQAPVVVCENA